MSDLKLGLVIGGAVSSSVGKAFKDVESRIQALDDKGAKARILQSTIGETIKLRDEWKKAHETGAAGASTLLSRLNANLASLKAQGVEAGRLGRAYEAMGRKARAAELQAEGRRQMEEGRDGLKSTAGQAVAATAVAVMPVKVSADYGAIIRDIAIKAGIANSPQEAQMSQTIVKTSRDTGMARNDVAEVVNALVGAGMDLKQAIDYAPSAAKFVVGQGADGADTARMINALGQNAKITDPKVMQQALEAIAYQGQAGSFEAADMAKWFPEMLAGMGKLGITGMDSVTQLGALLQVQMKTAGGADEAANNLKNWMEKIGSGDTVKAYKDVGIDYEASMQSGMQKGMSTLESSFALAQRYIQATDPKKAAAMAEATAKISKEADPVKAQAMINALEQALRTGDLFADMQVKGALTAFMQNKNLYEQLKNDSRAASGILDKNLDERRDASAQRWKEVGQSMDDALRSVGDALAPMTDAVASGITTVTRGLSQLTDESPKVVSGVAAVVAGFLALRAVVNTVKIGRGLMNLGRGTLMGNPNIPQKVIVMNPASGGGPDLGGADAERKKRGRRERAGTPSPGSPGGPASPAPPERAAKPRMRVYAGADLSKAHKPLSGWKPPTTVPRVEPVAATPKPAAVGAGPKVAGSGAVVFALLDAGMKAKDTYDTATTQDEKAEGYGEAAGGFAGTLAGAAAGAAIGSMVPVIGTIVGGVLGGYLGSLGGDAAGGYLGKKMFGGDESLKQMPVAGPLMMADAGKSIPPVLDDVAQSFKTSAPAPLLLGRSPMVAPADQRPVARVDKAPSMPAPVPLAPLLPRPSVVGPVEQRPVAQVDKAPDVPAPVLSVPLAPLLPRPPVVAPVEQRPVAPVEKAPGEPAPVLSVSVPPAPLLPRPPVVAPVEQRPVAPVEKAPGVPAPVLPVPAPGAQRPKDEKQTAPVLLAPVKAERSVTRAEGVSPVVSVMTPKPAAPAINLLLPERAADAQAQARPPVLHNAAPVPDGPKLGDVARVLAAKPAMATPAPIILKPEPPPKPAAPKYEQKVEIHAPITLTVQGDVKDPQQLMRELEPMIQRVMRDAAQQAQRSNLFDAPHVE
ncbi:phage tail tape measure protein, TP901 family [Pseudomonas sp. GM78]|uniref:phage tail tape measure protein n=1 Tax=Pseudomonas sp. GM78 TaxID=1144337 RepID=UPI00026F85F1|nr:phage tail tape measure protein [Pseudomonas sp. GM78]EJN31777.1 phage tail tape measure protein, TP901 family [Pseudomonas sp. GM78]